MTPSKLRFSRNCASAAIVAVALSSLLSTSSPAAERLGISAPVSAPSTMQFADADAAALASMDASAPLSSSFAQTAAAVAPRPDFRLPFPCNYDASLTTYAGHNPDDKKIDFFSSNHNILASADGYVHEQFSPGGIEIAHGNGWFTTYMHMTDRVAVGTTVRRGQRVGTMSNVGTGVVHLHYEQLYNPNSSTNADNQHIVAPVLQGVAIRFNSNYTYTPSAMTSTNCGTGSGGGGTTPTKYYVETFANAPGYASPTSTAQTGTLLQGASNYVFCKSWGRQIGSGASFNHWWLKTDLDSGPANQYVSAYYLARWGNDEAKDNNGTVIPDCATATKFYVQTFANAPGYASPTSTTQTGTLLQGASNYVFCKSWGRQIGSGASFNHWWLKTDLDSGPANQYVSAYYLSRWGNDEAKDNNGTVIPDC